MKRKMMSELIRWKNDPNKHGLVITGSRQIGKTYIIDEFARANYAQYLRIDFSSKPYLQWKQGSSEMLAIFPGSGENPSYRPGNDDLSPNGAVSGRLGDVHGQPPFPALKQNANRLP